MVQASYAGSQVPEGLPTEQVSTSDCNTKDTQAITGQNSNVMR